MAMLRSWLANRAAGEDDGGGDRTPLPDKKDDKPHHRLAQTTRRVWSALCCCPPFSRWKLMVSGACLVALLLLHSKLPDAVREVSSVGGALGIYAGSYLPTSASAADEFCAPCGCNTTLAQRAYCASDAMIQALSALDGPAFFPPPGPELLASLAPRMPTQRCMAAQDSVVASAGSGGPVPRRRHVLYHMYWRADLRPHLDRWQLAAILGVMATQPGNESTLVLWSPDADFVPEHAEVFRAFPGRVTYRVFSPRAEAAGGPLEGSWLLGLRDAKAWADSDIFRLVALQRYGGVYLDLDVLLFRDLSPLLGFEWASEFSCRHEQADLNNAAVRFFPRSDAITALAERAKWMLPKVMSWTYGPDLLGAVYRARGDAPPPFHALPWCFFHGGWCAGAVNLRGAVGDGTWDEALVSRLFGLHTHGLANREPVVAGSILARYEGVYRRALHLPQASPLPG